MNLITCFLLFFVIEFNDSSKLPNVIRIPLKRFQPEMRNVHARQTVIFEDKHYKSFGEISIGSPRQDFIIEFDTGSKFLWVYSTFYEPCIESAAFVLNKTSLYSHLDSYTYTQPTKELKPQKIGYQVHWVFGFWAHDLINIGGIKIQKKFVEVVVSNRPIDETPREHGILGMAYNEPENGNIINTICEQTNGESKFSFYLPRDYAAERNGTDGEVLLCGEDKSRYIDGTMKYHNDVLSGRWVISFDKVTVETGETNFLLASHGTALIDTGNIKIFMPYVFYTTILRYFEKLIIPESELKEMECSKVHLLPNITFHMSGTPYNVTGIDYTIKTVSGTCRIGIDYMQGALWNLGTPLIRRYYTVFDMGNRRIGFAEKID